MTAARPAAGAHGRFAGCPGEDERRLRAAAETGELDAMIELGHALEHRKAYREAEDWYRTAADRGLIGALGGLLHHTRGDFAQVERWYHHAIDAGVLPALTDLGSRHHDRGDRAAAEHWYRAAAEVGFPGGTEGLATLRVHRGDLEGAGRWYRRAADAGDPVAADYLARLLRRQARESGRPSRGDRK
ncbi:tetratricopeptide repeat protein [Amycolatopsis sp. NPDC051903]|uniref:tetratricopeptide repeat protein n=1 Tax=Amycolatopsis sp. NPDC051903 TaxID=3363936 RepID=UPI00378C885F